MSEVIKGIKLRVPGSDLAEHLAQRADYHDDKSQAYAEQAEGVKDLQGDEKRYSGSPQEKLESKYRKHEKKANYFRMLSEYVVEDATYELKKKHLDRIEAKQWHL